eukprot:TRINITY_DN13849_c0_g1_i1.p1 TRINITY_DN13849_c0_g1~~TRINITY_DN13849_c0_g1_i1.p1  ORF type:complete len:530 (+),score=149.81 TRINITY_DN13849_c0_g1_i1:118-1707(+)
MKRLFDVKKIILPKSGNLNPNKFIFEAAPSRTKFVKFRSLTSTEAASIPRSKPPLYFTTSNTQCSLFIDFFRQHGFRPVGNNPNVKYNTIWIGGHVSEDQLAEMNVYQRVNHHPASSNITKKDKLVTNVSSMNARFPGEFNFLPKTYRLPLDHNQMKKDAKTEVIAKDGDQLLNAWIIKPTTLSRGRGIQVIKSLSAVPYDPSKDSPKVVSRYVSNPYLIDGYKFDIRLYAVVTSVNPLRIYMNKEGLVRFSTEKYTMSEDELENSFRHLTNYSINRTNTEKYMKNSSEENDGVGHKWSLTALKDYLFKNGISPDKVMEDIEEVVVKTLISANKAMSDAFFKHVNYRQNCFEIYGFDILLDDKLKPWLMEVNLSPSMGHASPLDLKVKSTLMSDIYNAVGVRIPPEHPIATSEEKLFEQFHKTYPETALNPNYARVLTEEFRRELSNKGNLKCLYPNWDSDKYGKFFEIERPFNRLLIDYRIREKSRLNFAQKQADWILAKTKELGREKTSSPQVPLSKTEMATPIGNS